MEIKADFSEVGAPTAKQIDFVQEMCRVLLLENVIEYTFEAYSAFISDNIEEYQYSCYNGDNDGGEPWYVDEHWRNE